MSRMVLAFPAISGIVVKERRKNRKEEVCCKALECQVSY